MHTAKDPQTFEGKLTCAIGIHIPKQSGKVYLEDAEALQEEENYKKNILRETKENVAPMRQDQDAQKRTFRK